MESVNAAKQAVDGFLPPLTEYELKCWMDLYRALIAIGAIPKSDDDQPTGDHGRPAA